MAPSSRNKIQKRQARPDYTTAFRTTKSSKLNISKQKLDAIDGIVAKKAEPQSQSLPSKTNPITKKRRRDSDTGDSHEEGATVTLRPQKSARKARQTKIQLQVLTPPASSPEPEIEDRVARLPETLEELKSLHKSFTQALGVYYAHNGVRNAVELSALMPAMTRLWKMRSVAVVDIERMLAVWEVTESIEPGKEVEHKRGPFRLVVTGVGSNQQVKVENAWINTAGTFAESELHQRYEGAIERLWRLAQANADAFGYVYEPLVTFLRLSRSVGAQTQARQEKIGSIRDSILSKTSRAQEQTTEAGPDFSKLQISDPADSRASAREFTLKSRTLSLFDRLRAKQLANSSTPQDSASQLRRRALHRIPEMLDILRLRQSQKLNSLFRSDLLGAPGGAGARTMKVSFSLEQLVQEIRDSGKVPVAPEEIKECISILGREVPDTWCSVYPGESVKCVTLQGEGWRKEEVREWCEREIKRMDEK